jgi:hypothetical protein
MSLERADLTKIESWLQAFESGINGIKELGGSKEGDRTMIDALCTIHSLLFLKFVYVIILHSFLY